MASAFWTDNLEEPFGGLRTVSQSRRTRVNPKGGGHFQNNRPRIRPMCFPCRIIDPDISPVFNNLPAGSFLIPRYYHEFLVLNFQNLITYPDDEDDDLVIIQVGYQF